MLRRSFGSLRELGEFAWSRRSDPGLQAAVLLGIVFISGLVAFAQIAEDFLTGVDDPIVRLDVELSIAVTLAATCVLAFAMLSSTATFGRCSRVGRRRFRVLAR
jgi:hypothetical protein